MEIKNYKKEELLFWLKIILLTLGCSICVAIITIHKIVNKPNENTNLNKIHNKIDNHYPKIK